MTEFGEGDPPPVPSALVTLEQVKTFLQVAEDDTEQDAVIEMLIASVSTAFATYTHREFTPTAKPEARVFAHPGGAILDLAPYDLRSIDSLETDTETGDPTAVEAGTYSLGPKPARHGVYQRIRFHSTLERCEVQVEGEWGFETVPDDVQHFALTTIALWLRREVQAFERTFQIDEQRLERPEALPSAVRGGLATYRRPVLP